MSLSWMCVNILRAVPECERDGELHDMVSVVRDDAIRLALHRIDVGMCK